MSTFTLKTTGGTSRNEQKSSDSGLKTGAGCFKFAVAERGYLLRVSLRSNRLERNIPGTAACWTSDNSQVRVGRRGELPL